MDLKLISFFLPRVSADFAEAQRRLSVTGRCREGTRARLDRLGSIGQTLQGAFSAVSKRKFSRKYAFESSRRDLHNAILCRALQSQLFVKILPTGLLDFAKCKENVLKISNFCQNSGKFWQKMLF